MSELTHLQQVLLDFLQDGYSRQSGADMLTISAQHDDRIMEAAIATGATAKETLNRIHEVCVQSQIGEVAAIRQVDVDPPLWFFAFHAPKSQPSKGKEPQASPEGLPSPVA